MKVVTYPRVDTTFLPNDIYPKISGILSKLTNYSKLTKALLGSKIKKSKRVFDDKKVTDHHAIIPTGIQVNLHYNQQLVYDIITRRFIGAFYPDSEISNTAILAQAAEVPFKTTGKEILTKGWRIVFEKKENSTKKELNQQSILPTFIEGEQGAHQPSFVEKETKPPRNFSEASLLRAMETAGKQVDDDEMRELMKENGIGRPSTRASIIETLFRRKYIERKKKLVLPTQTGIDLINIIDNELLKSAELTGRWEKRLKEIERGKFNAGTFINNMKKMVDELVYEVRSNKNYIKISHTEVNKKPLQKKAVPKKLVTNRICPKCNTGQLLKGSKAFGCSNYNNSCDFLMPFQFLGKKISENQLLRLLDKKTTSNLKGFKTETGKVEGTICFDAEFKFKFVPKTITTQSSDTIFCPKCKKGTIIRGKNAYGCSHYKKGCSYVFTFEKVKEIANGKPLSKELVLEIISS